MDIQQTGTIRRMARLADAGGFFCVAAIDHPENYLELFDKDISAVPHETVVTSKLELVTELSRHASALLLDPMWSLGQAIVTRALPGSAGLIAPIERLAYTPAGFGPETMLRPGWSTEKISRLGADGVKLYLSYRADRAEVAASQRELVAGLVASCRELNLPLIVEPIWYALPGEDPADPTVRRRRAEAIVAAAAEFAAIGADILKVQFPGTIGTAAERESAAAAARDLDAACPVPWVLLSEGAGFDDFAVQMDIAARAGASGYIAGRAVWGDAVGYLPDDVRREAVARAAGRLVTLNDIVRAHGRPWADRLTPAEAAAAMPADWYAHYR